MFSRVGLKLYLRVSTEWFIENTKQELKVKHNLVRVSHTSALFPVLSYLLVQKHFSVSVTLFPGRFLNTKKRHGAHQAVRFALPFMLCCNMVSPRWAHCS